MPKTRNSPRGQRLLCKGLWFLRCCHSWPADTPIRPWIAVDPFLLTPTSRKSTPTKTHLQISIKQQEISTKIGPFLFWTRRETRKGTPNSLLSLQMGPQENPRKRKKISNSSSSEFSSGPPKTALSYTLTRSALPKGIKARPNWKKTNDFLAYPFGPKNGWKWQKMIWVMDRFLLSEEGFKECLKYW